MTDSQPSDKGPLVAVGCVHCGSRPAGVYYGHNTGKPFKVCAQHLASIKRYSLFRWTDGTSPRGGSDA